MIVDTHYHLDFLPAAARRPFLRQLGGLGVRIVAQTLLPSACLRLLHDLPPAEVDAPPPLVSVGFHPWCIASDEQAERELALLPEALGRTRLAGEIGLDHAPRRLAEVPAPLQRRVLRVVLERVCRAAAASPAEPCVLSIHAVRATTAVLDLLDEVGVWDANVVPVLHRFGGTSDELTRLVRRGGLVSVHPTMLTTKRGRAYVTQVPLDRLLLESDLPEAPVPDAGQPMPAAHAAAIALVSSLSDTLQTLTRLRGEGVAEQIAHTQARLYRITGTGGEPGPGPTG